MKIHLTDLRLNVVCQKYLIRNYDESEILWKEIDIIEDKNIGIKNMDDEKKITEKRSSFRGWKERNRGRSNQKMYIIGVATVVVIFSAFLIYQYSFIKSNNSIPVIIANSSTGGNNSSLIKVTPKITSPKITPVVTPGITKNITGKMGTPLVINGFEINVTRVGSSFLYMNVWIIAKNIDNIEKPLKIGPSTVVIDNMGEQYENVHVQRSSELIQTNLTAKAMRSGSIFFVPLKEGRSPKKLLLNINGQKGEIVLEK